MSKGISLLHHKNNFMKYRFLLKELVGKNIKLQYRDSFLGMFWTFLQPLLTMIVLTIVFGTLFGKDSKEVVNYPVYLLCGKLLFDFFSTSTKRAMRSIRGHAGIIKKVYVPKYIYPLADVVSTFVTFLISLIVLVAVIIFFNIIGYHPFHVTWRVVYAIVPLIILFFLALGVGMILSTLSVFFRDVENIYDVFSLLLFYVTPIMYHINKLGLEPGSWQMKIVKLNPLYGIIGNFRAAILWGNDFVHYWDMNLLYLDVAITIFCLVVGFAMFYKNQDKFILHI